MFMVLQKAKINEGFPLTLTEIAIEFGNVDAIDYLWEQTEAVLAWSGLVAMEKAARNGHLEVLKYLHAKRGIRFSQLMLEAAAGSGQLEVLQYLSNYCDMTRECLLQASRKGHLPSIEFVLSRKNNWGRRTCMLAIKNALAANYDAVETLIKRFRWGSYYKAEAKVRAISTGVSDMMIYYRGIRHLGRQRTTMSEALKTGDARIARLLHSKKACYSPESAEHAASKGHLSIIKFLFKHSNLPEVCYDRCIQEAIVAGHDEVTDYLCRKRGEPTLRLYKIVECGNLKRILYAHERCRLEGSYLTMDKVAQMGLLDVLQFLHENRKEGCTKDAMTLAAGKGHLDVVKWLHQNRKEGCRSQAMDMAACNGHLNVVIWLHENRHEGCTELAMDLAAMNNHLEIVKFLHFNRSEGCTKEAMDGAVASPNSTLAMVQFLHYHRSEGCTQKAMDAAAAKKDPSILRFLHFNRTEGCTVEAMNGAAELGLLENVKFLAENRKEGGTSKAVEKAIRNGHIEVARFLHPYYGVGVPYSRLFCDALSFGAIDVARFLLQESLVDLNDCAGKELAKFGYLHDVKWMQDRGCKITEGMIRDLWKSHPSKTIDAVLGVRAANSFHFLGGK
ncbi:hypothetical protein HDU97_000172 [Phlyctochytrium planicorne]|nr:hypothetical protein HDU97_000172 [Phlyctochytrium planicorne]